MNAGAFFALLFQAVNAAPLGSLSITELLTGLAAIAATILNLRLNATTNRLKYESTKELEGLRGEIVGKMEILTNSFTEKIDKISDKFVPGHLDIERRSQLGKQLEDLRTEVNRNRERIHDHGNTITQAIFGPIENIQNTLRDATHRVTVLEERERTLCDKVRTMHDDIRELSDRMNELERHK